MERKTVKVDQQTWERIYDIASRANCTMGEAVEAILDTYELLRHTVEPIVAIAAVTRGARHGQVR